MVSISTCFVLLVSFYITDAQWGFLGGGWNQPDMGMMRAVSPGRQWGRPMRTSAPRIRNRFQTCIGKNSNGDEMRVTFSLGETSRTNANNNNMNPWMMMWGQGRTRSRQTHRLNAVVSAGQASTLQGNFRFVVTRGSRTEEVCSMQALGRILTGSSQWGVGTTPHGVVGNTITLMPGQTATSTEILDNLQFNELPGRGLALCPAHMVSGSECRGVIPLCCKIGWDQQPAIQPFMGQGFMGNGMMGQNMITMSNTGGSMMHGNSGLVANNIGMQSTGGLAF